MLQTWSEHRPNHDALLRELRRESGLTPYQEAAKWRHRFFYALLILAGQAVVIVGLLLRKGNAQ